MSDAKDCVARVDASVKRLGKRHYEAWPRTSSGCGVSGFGSTEKEAIADLARNLAWVAHNVGAEVAFDGEGKPWIVTVAYRHGTWIVRRATPEGMSQGSTVATAPTWSAIKAHIRAWNKPLTPAQVSE